MKSICRFFLPVPALFLLLAGNAAAEIKVTVAHPGNAAEAQGFAFKNGPTPRRSDAATTAKFTLLDGRRDGNGGTLEVLHDGQVPTEADQPGRNFFFASGTAGGRILVDLGKVIPIREIDTYSWHPGVRAPQVYTVYASDGAGAGFSAEPKRPLDPATAGWKPLAKVDTRPASGNAGGPYGVSMTDSANPPGSFRYLLFDIQPSREGDPFGQTFFSEIDVVDRAAPAVEPPVPVIPVDSYTTTGGRETFTIACQDAPDMHDWTHTELAPVLQQWYPKIVELLASDGFEAPRKFSIVFASRKNLQIDAPAYTSGTRVTCNADWQRQNLKGEAIGCVIHELVHVVQQYGAARRGRRVNQPGWLTEGIPDYIRWYLYEPQAHGADIGARSLARARYDGSYRVSANFLNWVTETHDKKIVMKLNAMLRQGTYDDAVWNKETGRTIEELDGDWKADLAEKLNIPAPAKAVPPTGQNPLPKQSHAAGDEISQALSHALCHTMTADQVEGH
ncbi:MAG: basic secretory family protein [Akkermansiaceae bacterium]|nr:basic secretory family protein [Akkermansiaceae bacterium]